MMKRLAMLMLVGLVAGCGTIVHPVMVTPIASGVTVPRIPTPRSSLAMAVRQEVAPYPSANWCDKGISRQPIEDYNASLAQALADLLVAPEASTLSDSDLASIYQDGAQPHVPVFQLVSGGDWLLATLPTYYESCVMGSHYIPVMTRLVVFDRVGHWWTVKTVTTNAESGTFLFADGAVQWAGDRWVVMLNDLNTLGFTGFGVVHILREGDTWAVKNVLQAEDKDGSYFTPTMQLSDGYQTLVLTSNHYASQPPCMFEADIADRYAWAIDTIENAYHWDGAAYVLDAERVVNTRVILYAGKQRETYETLEDWRVHCKG